MRHTLRSVAVASSALALVASVAAAPAQARPQEEPQTVATGLVGPLSLAVGQGQDVFVSQSFIGVLSKVTRQGGVQTIATVPETGSISGVAFHKGATYHLEGDFSGEMPATYVVRTDRHGNRTVVSDNFWDHEMSANPDAGTSYGFVGLDGSCADDVAAFQESLTPVLGDMPLLLEYTGIVESNAYQLSVAGDGTIYVADAAANAVLRVDHDGSISTVSVLPASTVTFSAELQAAYEELLAGAGVEDVDIPDCVVGRPFTHEPVPTDVQVGHQGALYVSTLQGLAGEVMPLSQVYRIDASTGAATSVAGGMHGATGLAVAPNGLIFVAELFGGRVSVVRGGSVQTVFEADTPSDVALQGSWLYATTGVFGPGGSLVKLLHPKGGG